MPDAIPKKSPRAPTMSLREAIDKASKVYDRERLHEAPTDIIAQHIGYKNANSGSALSAIASLRYLGLLNRPRNGFLAVSKDLESMKFAPTNDQRQSLIIQFLMTPPLYVDLLKKYETGLPSDATLKYELIQRGFIPAAAATVMAAFKESVEFANFYGNAIDPGASNEGPVLQEYPEGGEEELQPTASTPVPSSKTPQKLSAPPLNTSAIADELETIPVRLSGGRKAWLQIPAVFFKADKERLKAQIDLLLAEDEDY